MSTDPYGTRSLLLLRLLGERGPMSYGELREATRRAQGLLLIGSVLDYNVSRDLITYMHGMREGAPVRLYTISTEGRAKLAAFREALGVEATQS